MPLPRTPRPKRRLGGSRSSRRRQHQKAWLSAKLIERFVRYAELLEERKQAGIANGAYLPPQEKAPGQTAEGSFNPVIPGEDPGPPETQTTAVVPDRPCRPSGMTVLAD